MYFTDRASAGRKLAELLQAYKSKNTVVIALSEGSTVVAAQVALQLHASMALYMIKDITLPNEIEAAAALSSSGIFQYNSLFSAGEVEEMASEYRSYFDEQRIQKNHELNLLLGDKGTIKKELLRHHTVIVVADGIASGFALSMVAEFLRTIAIERFVIATPIASVEAIDRMHILADELQCLSVPEHFMNVDHYYEENVKITVADAIKIISNISLLWEGSGQNLDEPKAEATSKPSSPPSSSEKHTYLS
jgi:predicted phosphoribosyltransferase